MKYFTDIFKDFAINWQNKVLNVRSIPITSLVTQLNEHSLTIPDFCNTWNTLSSRTFYLVLVCVLKGGGSTVDRYYRNPISFAFLVH